MSPPRDERQSLQAVWPSREGLSLPCRTFCPITAGGGAGLSVLGSEGHFLSGLGSQAQIMEDCLESAPMRES